MTLPVLSDLSEDLAAILSLSDSGKDRKPVFFIHACYPESKFYLVTATKLSGLTNYFTSFFTTFYAIIFSCTFSFFRWGPPDACVILSWMVFLPVFL